MEWFNAHLIAERTMGDPVYGKQMMRILFG